MKECMILMQCHQTPNHNQPGLLLPRSGHWSAYVNWCTGHTTWPSTQGFQSGIILTPRAYLAAPANIFGCHKWRKGVTGIEWVETGILLTHYNAQNYQHKKLSAQNVNSAKIRHSDTEKQVHSFLFIGLEILTNCLVILRFKIYTI